MSVEPKTRDQLYKELAQNYVEHQGTQLQEELRELEAGGALFATPRLDRRVRRNIAALRRRPYVGGAALVAACIVLMLLFPRMLGLDTGQLEAPSAAESASAAESETAPPAGELALLPLTFQLPEQFSVAGSQLDQGMSIYYLENAALDDVVLTMEITGEGPASQGLTPIQIGETTAYGTAGPDYSLLTFLQGEIVYTLTCRHDINTLVGLSRSIL